MPELTHDDAVAALQKLPPDKQREVLGKLTPEGRKNLLAKINGAAAPATTPAAPGLRAQADSAVAPQNEAGSGIVGRLKNAAKGIIAPFEGALLHPVQTVEGMGREAFAFGGPGGFGIPSIGPTGNTERDITNVKERDKAIAEGEEQGKEDLKHPVYTAASIIGPALITHAVGRGIQAVRGTPLPEAPGVKAGAVRSAIRETLGVGEEFQKKAAENYSKENADIQAANQKATETTLRERGAVDEQNKAAARQHVKKTVKQLKQDAAKLREAGEARARVQAENEQTATEHKADVEKSMQEREGAEQVAGMREQAETEATQEAEKLKSKTAQTKATAKAKNDTLWKDLREKIGSDPIDATGKFEQEVDSVKKGLTSEESEQLDAVLRSQMSPEEAAEDAQLGEAYNNLSPEFKGHVDKMTGTLDQLGGIDTTGAEAMTFPKLQNIYTELGLKLSRGGLAGNVYYGLVKLRESIGDMMQTVADQKGAGADLKAARKSHQEFADAFYKDRSKPLSVADKLLKDSNPEAYAADEDKKQVAKMAKHDPSIAEDYKRVEAAREKARSLPQPEQLRKGLTQPPDRPAEKALPELPTPRPLPEKPPTKSYAEPKATTPEADVPDLTKVTREHLHTGLKKYGKIGTWVARLLFGGGLIHAFHGDLGVFTSQLAVGEVGLQVLSRYLQGGDALDWLAKPTPETLQAIDSLPPQDAARLRSALTGLIKQDLNGKTPGNIDPRIQKFLSGPKAVLVTAGANTPQTAGEAKKRVAEARK